MTSCRKVFGKMSACRSWGSECLEHANITLSHCATLCQSAIMRCSPADLAGAVELELPRSKEESSVRLSTKGRLGRMTYKMPVTQERAARKEAEPQLDLRPRVSPALWDVTWSRTSAASRCKNVQSISKHHGACRRPELRATSTCDSAASCTFPGTQTRQSATL